MDNILIAFETLHCMKNYKSGSIGYMALKLDMSKAYDLVEWNFLEKLMLSGSYYDLCKNCDLLCDGQW